MGKIQNEQPSRPTKILPSLSSLRELGNWCPDPIFLADSQGILRIVNKAAEDLTGYRTDELEGQSHLILFPAERRTEYAERLSMAVAGARQLHKDLELERKDGRRVFVNVNATRLVVAGEIYLLGFFRDITARKQFETAVAEAQKHQEALLRSMPDGLVIFAEDLKIVQFRDTDPPCIGLQPREVLGRPFTEIWAGRALDGQELKAALEDVLCDGKPRSVHGFKLTLKTSGGIREATVDVFLCRVEYHGKPHLLATFRDSSPWQELTEKIRETERLRTINQLLSGIAHDFNNFVCGIMNLAQLLAQRLPEGTAERDQAEKIARTAERAVTLSRRLLDIRRTAELALAPLNLKEVLQEVGEIVALDSHEKIRVRFEVADQLPQVVGDRTLLAQALLNLCHNSIEAMPEGGELTLGAGYDPGKKEVILRVRDTGCGIPPELKGKIFEPFFTTRRERRGTGLGLTMVQAVVSRHGGTLHVESTVGQGTEMIIRLPAAGGS